ncbi:MAG TPA: L-serine ammonia-lyase, iron-sulfur-dependent, subunit beta [Clostridiaceae bacterium]|nr:L-serine ammonia-lyase, iron-sulfur-dependent, subunit beta [Clostridiaceae bacterium]
MNVFDIIGPVMVGPSSSHTAGAVRIGNMARALLGEPPAKVNITLYGSFAHTYRGHGTDKALVAGLMEMTPDDLRIKSSLDIARSNGIVISFVTSESNDYHPNTVLIKAEGSSGKKISVLGSSIGGGNIVINRINGIDVQINGQYHTLVIPHRDAPGTIALVTNQLAINKINIAQMKVYRSDKGGKAVMVIETDQPVSEELASAISKLNGIYDVTVIKPLK